MMTALQLSIKQCFAKNSFVFLLPADPAVPRNKRAPGGFEVGTGTPLFPVTPEQVYRRIYFEKLDLIVSSIALKNVLISLVSKNIPIWSLF